MTTQSNPVIVGLDLGTTKIGVIIAEIDSKGELKIVGVGNAHSTGMKRGTVVNIEKTVQSIRKAVEEAELMAGIKIDNVYVGIAGEHIQSINSRGVIAVSRDDNEITHDDIRRVIDAAKAVALPSNTEIIHILPQEFIVDKQDGIRDPVGMAGVRLEAEVHIVTGAVTSAQNIYKSVRRSNLEIRDLVLEPLASSYAVLADDERDLGVVLMDVGGGTTDIAMFFEGSIRHTASVALGGSNVTNDIALGLRTPLDQAEEIKIKYGCALQNLVKDGEIIQVPGVGGRQAREVSRNVLAAIIQPRMEEIFSLSLREMKRSEYFDFMSAGVVLTGGGALLEGCIDLAEIVLGMPAKLGIPTGFGGLVDAAKSPIYATGVGLVQYGQKHMTENRKSFGGKEKALSLEKVIGKMKEWLEEFF